jgi:hypothetical protein
MILRDFACLQGSQSNNSLLCTLSLILTAPTALLAQEAERERETESNWSI